MFPCVCNHVERPCDSTGDELADQGKIEQSPAHHRSTFFFFFGPVLFCGPLFVTVSEDLILRWLCQIGVIFIDFYIQMMLAVKLYTTSDS